MKRIFLIVLDSFGIGAMEDAVEYGDKGTNTLGSIKNDPNFYAPNLEKMGLFQIDGENKGKEASFCATIGRMKEASKGKDTTMGHWEIAGVYSPKALPTYPDGFPEEIINKIVEITGRGILCNETYSGTKVIEDYGKEHLETGKLIVYTSADSVLQIAAHEEIVDLNTLYDYCEKVREIMQGEHGVGRVIARPFITKEGVFTRSSGRHDYSLLPPSVTMLEQLQEAGYETIGVGKIRDIFAGAGISKYEYSASNEEGIQKTLSFMEQAFEGLCFVNLVDFDMLYGHRNDIPGYAKAISAFDKALPSICEKLEDDDILMITADHGCDPGYVQSTDHSREYVPFLMYGKKVKVKNLGTRETFADIGATVLQYFGIEPQFNGSSMW